MRSKISACRSKTLTPSRRSRSAAAAALGLLISADTILVMNADGTGAQNVTNDPIADAEPDWQPLPGPQREDYKNAKRYCKALRSYLGDDAFRARFGGKHARRTCVRLAG
jgi:hypothetical protein